jgi:hypothetical protein
VKLDGICPNATPPPNLCRPPLLSILTIFNMYLSLDGVLSSLDCVDRTFLQFSSLTRSRVRLGSMLTNKDTLLTIFKWLDVESLTQVEQVCRSWNEIVSKNDSTLWRFHFLDIKPLPADPQNGSKLRWKSKHGFGFVRSNQIPLARYLQTGLIEQLAPFDSKLYSVQPPTLDTKQITYKNCYAMYWIVTQCKLLWRISMSDLCAVQFQPPPYPYMCLSSSRFYYCRY